MKGKLKMSNNLYNIERNDINSNSRTSRRHNSHSKKSFWKSGKKIAIIILSFLLLCSLASYSDSDFSKVDELTNQIETLQQENSDLNSELEETQNQLTTLQETNKSLEEEKENLETQINELNSKVEELENEALAKASDSSTTSSQTQTSSSSSSTSSSQSQTSSSTSSSTSGTSSSSSTTDSSDSNSEMVWVGETGTKYHYQWCGTLKGKGHQITLQQALSEGREACKVCH